MNVESQIILISSVFGGVCLLLLIGIICLCAKVDKLSKERKSSSSSSRQRENDLYAYNNSTLQPDEELSKRGFVMHDVGKSSRLQNNGNDPYSIPRESIMQTGQRSTNSPATGPIQRPSQFNQYYGAGAGMGMQTDRKQSKKELPNDFVGSDADIDDMVFGKQQQPHPKQSLSQQQQERYPSLQQPQQSTNANTNGPRHSQFNNNILYGNVSNQYVPPNQQQQQQPQSTIDDKAYYNNNRAINNMY